MEGLLIFPLVFQGGEEAVNYLEYGNPRLTSGKLATVSNGVEVTRVREAGEEGGEKHPHAPSLPPLPALDTSRLNAGGLRRLQEHLERLGEGE